MAKKNKPKKEDSSDKIVMKEDDPSFTESFAGESIQSVRELLGTKAIEKDSSQVMLRFESEKITDDHTKHLKLRSGFVGGFVVGGPYSLDQVEDWCSKGIVRRNDEVLMPYHRWIPCLGVITAFKKAEMTATQEVTSSFSLSGSKIQNPFSDDDSQETPSTPFSDLESLPENSLELEPHLTHASDEKKESVRVTESQTGVVASPLLQRQQKKPASNVKDNGVEFLQPSAMLPPKQKTATVIWVLVSVFLVLVFFSVKSLIRKPLVISGDPTKSQLSELNQISQMDLSAEWPDWMKPLGSEALLDTNDGLLLKLSELIQKFRLGNVDFSDQEMSLLKRLSSPATASWTARKLASNMLAVTMASKNKESVDSSLEVLRPIYQSSPDDLPTVLNLSLLTLLSAKYDEAEALAQVALRLCSPATCWFSNLLMAKIKVSSKEMDSADRYFQSAADDYAEPLLTYGMWSVFGLDPQKQNAKSKSTLEKALWGDPDRFYMSPLPDGIGFRLLYEQLNQDLQAKLSSFSLSPGMQDYLMFRLNRMLGNYQKEKLLQSVEQLGAEASPLSQAISAYLKSTLGQFDSARESLSSALVLIKDRDHAQGWPWALAADLQIERGHFDQALILYQNALTRQPRERAAVFGMGLLLRRKMDFLGAKQKFAEASAMDPQFVLPKLRLTRFEWHRRIGDK